MTPPLRIPLAAAAAAARRPAGSLLVLTAAFDPAQPRVDSGPQGGQWTATGDSGGSNAPEADAATKKAFQDMLGMTPAQRAAFLAGMSPDQLKKMGALMAQSKTAKGDIAQIRNAVGDTLKAKGIDPGSVGLGPKGAAKKGKAAGKGKGGSGSKGGGGKSGGGKKSGGSGKKSGGGGKSSGGSKSSSGSKKSSNSSASKKAATTPTAKTTATKAAKPAPPPKPTPKLKPIGRRPGPPQTPPGVPRPSPVRASAAPRVVLVAAAPKPPRISLGRGEEP